MHSKWSTPVVQKQRVAYMNNLTSKVRSRGTYETDQFNERLKYLNIYFSLKYFLCRRWNKASNELQSHVITSRSRKADALSIVSKRASRPFSDETKEDATDRSAVVYSTPSRSAAKRGYGFATSNLNNFSDQHSEDLYRYKNISSDYMRETSPTRDDDRPPISSGSRRAANKRFDSDDDDDKPIRPSNTDRFASRRKDDDDDQPVRTLNTSRFAARRKDDDDDQPFRAANADRSAFRKNNDDDDQPVRTSNIGRSAARRKDDDDDKPVRTANDDRSAFRRNNDDDNV
jgi:hypothetical protein